MKNGFLKTILFALKFAALVIVSTIGFMAVSAFLPFSDAFVSGSRAAGDSALPFVLLNNAWMCLAIVYIVLTSGWRKRRLIPAVIFTVFMVAWVMTQIETAFFREAFRSLTSADMALIALSNGVFLLIAVPLAVTFFGRVQSTEIAPAVEQPQNLKTLMTRLGVIGVAYLVVYFFFGYFVAWREPQVRVFYSGSSEDHGFIQSLIDNYRNIPVIYPFQVLRGILFGLFVLPLVNMFRGRPSQLLISLVLVYSCTGMGLLIPNFLFPDAVRWAHFREMMSSMFLFAIIVWLVFTRIQPANSKVVEEPAGSK